MSAFFLAVSTGRCNTCVTPLCWGLDPALRGLLVINRRLRVRQSLARPTSAPLLASRGPTAPLSLLLCDFNVSFRFMSIHAVFCVLVRVLRRPIEITANTGHSRNCRISANLSHSLNPSLLRSARNSGQSNTGSRNALRVTSPCCRAPSSVAGATAARIHSRAFSSFPIARLATIQ